MRMRLISRAAARGIALAFCLGSGRAQASDEFRLSIDWGRLADVLNDGSSLLPHESSRVEKIARPTWAPESRWIGISPHLSVVARDWSGAQLLLGHLMLTDELRLSRSCRMILSRLLIVDGRVAPFVQAGFGQWRVDTDLMPIIRADVEIAAQFGGGFEIPLYGSAAIAIETDYTVLYREQHAPQMISDPHPWVTFLAARTPF
jgi:hypothetical protein